jgi:hypothetical protein
MYVNRILVSPESRKCLQNENAKLSKKLEVCFAKLLRTHKIQNPGKAPNICDITTKLAARMHNVRICPVQFNEQLRAKIAASCCKWITRLIHVLHNISTSILTHTKQETFVVGLLYLMRTGLVIHNTYVLPKCHALHRLLPLESHLQPHFGIKCKSITEIENLIKIQIRDIGASQVRKLGLHIIDLVLA